MKYKQMFAELESQGCRVVDRCVYGHMNGYPWMIASINGYMTNFMTTITMATELEKDSAVDLRKHLQQEGVKTTVSKRVVVINFALKKKTEIEDILGQIDSVTRVLSQSGIKAPTRCSICGQDGADTYLRRVKPRIMYDAVHASCINQMEAELSNKADENPGSYLTGIIGALLGAIVGMLPAFLGIYVLNIASAWLFLLLPIATYYGYKLFKGKMNVAAPICSVLFSLVGLGILLLAWDVATNMSIYGISFQDAIYFTMYYTFVEFSLEYWSWLGSNIATVVIFYGLGVVFSLGFIRKTNQSELKGMSAIRQTAMPITEQVKNDF